MYALPISSSKNSMTSICHNHGYSWNKYNFWNKNDSKGQGALEHLEGGGEPFDTSWRDGESTKVNYQRSYDLSDSLSVDTHLLVMDPMDHFHLLTAEDDLKDCFLHLPMLENIPFVLSYETIAQVQPGDAQLQQLCIQKPNQFVQ
jgi:hypothetical protein